MHLTVYEEIVGSNPIIFALIGYLLDDSVERHAQAFEALTVMHEFCNLGIWVQVLAGALNLPKCGRM